MNLIVGVIFTCFFVFIIFFTYKMIEYFIVSVDLFKQINESQKNTLNVLNKVESHLSMAEKMTAHSVDTVSKSEIIKTKRKSINLDNTELNDEEIIEKYKQELSKLGYSLSGSENEWVIKPEKGSLKLYAHSMEKLKSNAESIIKQHTNRS